MPGGLLLLADELCMEVILNLSPRHVYKLMQTSKRLCRLCTSERYWERVATYVAWAKARETNPLDMVLLPKSYRATMDEYIQGVRDDIGTCFPPTVTMQRALLQSSQPWAKRGSCTSWTGARRVLTPSPW